MQKVDTDYERYRFKRVVTSLGGRFKQFVNSLGKARDGSEIRVASTSYIV